MTTAKNMVPNSNKSIEGLPPFLIRVPKGTRGEMMPPEPVRPLIPSEYDAYLSAASLLSEYERYVGLLGLVVQNDSEFHAVLDKATTEIRSRGWSLITLNRVLFQANRRLANYLSAIRLYLDHTDRRLARRFGDESSERTSFNTACSQAYDNLFSYRFLYRLRNYVQHRGLPVGKLDLTSPENDQAGAAPALNLYFDSQYLLKDYSGWSSVAEDLREMPHHFPVAEHVAVMTRELKKIHALVIKHEYEEVRRAGEIVMEVLQDALGTAGVPALGDASYDAEKDVTTYEIEWPPLRMLQHLKLLGVEKA